jgi:hypothetical protein
MVMDTVQIRLSHKIIEQIDKLVIKDVYSSRGEVIRDALRHFILDQQLGSIPYRGDGIKLTREVRRRLSKQPFNLEEINKL